MPLTMLPKVFLRKSLRTITPYMWHVRTITPSSMWQVRTITPSTWQVKTITPSIWQFNSFLHTSLETCAAKKLAKNQENEKTKSAAITSIMECENHQKAQTSLACNLIIRL